MRRAALVLAGFLAAVAASLAGVLAWLRVEDPLHALPRDAPAAVSVAEEWAERGEGRTLLHVALRGPNVGEVRFVASLPDPLPPGRIPVAIVLGGLEGGTRSMRRIAEAVGDAGPNAFVAYDWPLPSRPPSAGELALHLAPLRRAVLSVPGQVDAVLAWASRQPWADPERASLLAFSLGAFVAPAAQRVAQERGPGVRWTVIAYGGAPIGAVIAGHPGVRPRWAAGLIGSGADLLLRPVEPSVHLPRLHGRFLVLRAADDRFIARAAADRLAQLTPEPRTIIVVEGDHVGLAPDKKKLLARVVGISKEWMVEHGAIAPVSFPP